MRHVHVVGKPCGGMPGRTAALHAVSEEGELIAVALASRGLQMPSVVPPFRAIVRMGRVVGWKFERIARDGLLKAQEGPMTHSDEETAEAEHEPPEPPSTPPSSS